MTQQALRELVAKWRNSAERNKARALKRVKHATSNADRDDALHWSTLAAQIAECADELESLLGEQREAQGAEVPEVTHYQGARVKCTPHMRPIIDLESRDNKFDYFLVRAEVKSAPPLAESVGEK